MCILMTGIEKIMFKLQKLFVKKKDPEPSIEIFKQQMNIDLPVVKENIVFDYQDWYSLYSIEGSDEIYSRLLNDLDKTIDNNKKMVDDIFDFYL